jgi:uncharacterized coiled-coil DUF342 family protein
MQASVLISIFSLIVAALGVGIAWATLAKSRKKDTADEGESKGFLASEIGYIKAGVDDLKREIREIRHEVGELSTRVARCEESCKQAHRRIDEVHAHFEAN